MLRSACPRPFLRASLDGLQSYNRSLLPKTSSWRQVASINLATVLYVWFVVDFCLYWSVWAYERTLSLPSEKEALGWNLIVRSGPCDGHHPARPAGPNANEMTARHPEVCDCCANIPTETSLRRGFLDLAALHWYLDGT